MGKSEEWQDISNGKNSAGYIMRRQLSMIAVLVFSTTLVACGGGGSSSGITNDGVTGNWSGTWRSSTGQAGQLTASFTQSGGTFSGPTTIYNSVCFGKEYSTGTVSGSTIQIAITNNGIIFDGAVSGNTVSGTYLVYRSGACYGDAGTFVMTK